MGEEDQGWRFDRQVVRMAFDAILALVVGTVGWIVYGINGELRDIKIHDKQQAEAIAAMRERLPVEYVRMDLYMRDRAELREVLNRIDNNVREHREALGDVRRYNGK
jgi:hypothetical protein